MSIVLYASQSARLANNGTVMMEPLGPGECGHWRRRRGRRRVGGRICATCVNAYTTNSTVPVVRVFLCRVCHTTRRVRRGGVTQTERVLCGYVQYRFVVTVAVTTTIRQYLRLQTLPYGSCTVSECHLTIHPHPTCEPATEIMAQFVDACQFGQLTAQLPDSGQQEFIHRRAAWCTLVIVTIRLVHHRLFTLEDQ
ncbi:unnamed protein product [Sphagnum balticum]